MMDGMHFLPFLHPAATAAEILAHAERHDLASVPPLTGYDDRSPRVALLGPSAVVQHIGEHVRWWPWWVLAALLALGAWRKPTTVTLAAGVIVSTGDLDFGVAFAGLVMGRLVRGTEIPGTQGRCAFVTLVLVWSLVSLMIASIFGSVMLENGTRFGGWLLVPGLVIGVLALRFVQHIWTRVGRARIKAAITQTLNHEWWPTWALYLPTVLHIPLFALRYRGLTVFTACNPGIENGGGFVGESKSAIMTQLPADCHRVLRTVAIDAGGPDRASAVIDLIENDPTLGGYPIVLKPDAGQRGIGVHLARCEQDVRDYIGVNHAPVVVQAFHAGPGEAGIFWMRKTKADDPRPIHERDGFISSITLKRFQFLEGDGKRTIRQLIIDHPRYRCQMKLFFERFTDRLDDVLGDGERLQLSFMGNHAQGTLFVDGASLHSPALEQAINNLARSYANDGFDFGRFDIRFENEESLKRGQGFAVLEANGTTSEPTNIYDPAHSPMFAWRTLREHWEQMYRIGRERVAAGGKALKVPGLIRLVVRGV